MFRKQWLLAGLASAAIVTAGYGVGPAIALAAPHAHARHVAHNRLAYYADQIHLTQAQREKIKAIAEKYRARMKAQQHGQGPELKKLLTAPKLDTTALKNFLNARQQAREAAIPTHVQMLAGMRNVLTDSQRQQLAQLLNKPMPEEGQHAAARAKRMHDRLVHDLQLSASQTQALDKLQSQMQAQMRDQRAAMRQALANFAKNGDTGALSGALKANAQHAPIDAIADFASTLNQAQRVKLVHHFAMMRERFTHNHG